MVFVYRLDKGNKKCVMKNESNNFINIKKTLEYFATDTPIKLPQIHTVTGCDKTCFLHGVGKTKAQTGCYSGKEERSMLQAFKRIQYQVYYWSRAYETIISDILLQDNGGIVENENDEVHHLSLTGTLLISFFHFHNSQQI